VDCAVLREHYNDPVNFRIFELISTVVLDIVSQYVGVVRDFSGVSSLGLIEDILGSDLDLRIGQVLLDEEEIDSRGSDDDIHGRIKFCRIECLDKRLGARGQAI